MLQLTAATMLDINVAQLIKKVVDKEDLHCALSAWILRQCAFANWAELRLLRSNAPFFSSRLLAFDCNDKVPMYCMVRLC